MRAISEPKPVGQDLSCRTAKSGRTSPALRGSAADDIRWLIATILCPAAGGILLWLAFPPLGWWPLAWIAPLPWLGLVLLPPPAVPRSRVISWAGFLLMWGGGFIHWLLILQGIRLAHPALIGGWIALSFYLAFYLPAFMLLTRVAVHRLGISLVIAAPVVWVGLELIRGYLLTGFSLSLLAHSQVQWTTLLQIADLAGAYGVSFVMMLTTACFARVGQDLSCRPPNSAGSGRINPALRFWPAAVAIIAPGGHARLRHAAATGNVAARFAWAGSRGPDPRLARHGVRHHAGAGSRNARALSGTDQSGPSRQRPSGPGCLAGIDVHHSRAASGRAAVAAAGCRNLGRRIPPADSPGQCRVRATPGGRGSCAPIRC